MDRDLLPIGILHPTIFDKDLYCILPPGIDRDNLDWDDRTYLNVLKTIWSTRPLEYEVQQLNELLVPPHLFEYRDLVKAQILFIRALPFDRKTLKLIALEPLLIREVTAISYLVKEHYRYQLDEAEPPRNDEERRIGFRFGDLVQGKEEDHELYHWPSYVAATTTVNGQDFVWVRKSLYKPTRSPLRFDVFKLVTSEEDIWSNDLVEYPAREITRVPPILREARFEWVNPFVDRNDIPAPLDNDFRDHFPNVRTR